MFAVAGLCAFEAKLENKLVAYCCRKVNIQFNNNLWSIIGYVMEEKHGRWSILLKDNSIISMRPVLYNNKMSEYSFLEAQNLQKGHFIATKCWPILISIHAQGKIRFVCNGVGF